MDVLHPVENDNVSNGEVRLNIDYVNFPITYAILYLIYADKRAPEYFHY
jgi:hypothetical protein